MNADANQLSKDAIEYLAKNKLKVVFKMPDNTTMEISVIKNVVKKRAGII